MRLKWAFLIIALLVLVAAAVWLGLFKSHKSQIATSGRPLPPLAFHPDNVVEFSWSTQGETFKFHRGDVNTPWTPDVDPQFVQSRLVLLSQVHRREISPENPDPRIPSVTVDVRMNDGTLHSGRWTPQNFVWQNGPLRGQGAVLLTEEAVPFFEGRFAFRNKKWNWCDARVQQFEFNDKSGSKNIAFANGSWVVFDPKAKNPVSTPIDSTVIEKWLGENCFVSADFLIDPSLSQIPPISQFSVVARFDRDRWVRFDLGDKNLIMTSTSKASGDVFYFVSTRLAHALATLNTLAH